MLIPDTHSFIWNTLFCPTEKTDGIVHRQTFIPESLFAGCSWTAVVVKWCVIDTYAMNWISTGYVFCCFQGVFDASLLHANRKVTYSYARRTAHKWKLSCELFSEIIKYIPLTKVWINLSKSWFLHFRNCPPLERGYWVWRTFDWNQNT